MQKHQRFIVITVSRCLRTVAFLTVATWVAVGTQSRSLAQGPAPAAAVYSAAQADRGRSVVQTHCAACHGDDLTGLEGPALVGASFMLKWEHGDVAALFRKIRDTMPPGEATSISESEKIDAVAYLLQQNGFKEGAVELPRDPDALARIPMSPQSGPIALRTGSLVRVTGCLTQGDGKSWTLTHATELKPAAASSVNAGGDAALGDATVQLLSVFPDPASHKGHKVEVTGLLVRDATGVSVNTMSLDMVSAACAP
jgi:mono/diheme cytochrome c family protein